MKQRGVLGLASVSSLGLAVVVACGGSTNAAAPVECNLDSDCSRVEDVCRAHKCTSKSGSAADAGDPALDSGMPDAAAPSDAMVLGDADPLASCTVVDVPPQEGPVVLEIVLDGSGSMESDSKWIAVSQGLGAFFNELGATPPPGLAVGLLIFEDTNDPTKGQGPYPSNIDVYPNLITPAQVQSLTNRLNAAQPNGGTPSLLALTGAYNLLKSYVIAAGSPLVGARKAALFISDGVPNGGTSEQGTCVSTVAAAFALPAPTGPVYTYSVGVGAFPGAAFSYDPKFMGEIAVAGGTRASPTCDPASTNLAQVCHVQITPNSATVPQMKQLFLNAARRARIAQTGCDLSLAPGTSFDPSRARVTIVDIQGGLSTVTAGGPDGWSFDDATAPTKVTFAGASCAALASASAIKIEACSP